MAILTITNNVGTASLNSFLGSAIQGYHCNNPDLSPYSVTYYHDGAGAYPVYGDTIYTDANGTSPVVSASAYQADNLSYFCTDENGIMVYCGNCL